MSYSIVKNTRDLLVADSELLNYVSSSDIRAGYSGEITSLPTIIISTVSETDTAHLGYGTAPSGSRLHRIDAVLQIDILTRKSMKEALDIADRITAILMNNGKYSKSGENDFWNDTYKAFHKVLRFRYFDIVTR